MKNNITRKTPSDYNKKYSRNSNYFDVIDSENKAYFLGLIYADGNNYYKNNEYSITLSLQERDGYLIEKLAEEIQYTGLLHYDELNVVNENHKNNIRITINDEHMSNQLISLGVVKNKSLILKFPDFLPDEYLRHFVRGFFDGDGGLFYYDKDDKLFTNTTSTFEFLSGLKNVLDNKLGCNCHMYKPKSDFDSNTYVLSTSGNKSSLKFLSWIYDDCEIKMMRKFTIYRCAKISYETKMKTRKINDLYE